MKKISEAVPGTPGQIEKPNDSLMPPSLARWPGYALGWLSAMGLGYYEKTLEPFGIRAPHVAVLVILDAEGDMVQARLSERLRIDRATMVGVLNDLQEKTWIVRKPHPTDRRAFHAGITASGRKALKKISRVSDEGTRLFFSVLSDAELQVFHKLLLKLATQPAPAPPAS